MKTKTQKKVHAHTIRFGMGSENNSSETFMPIEKKMTKQKNIHVLFLTTPPHNFQEKTNAS